MQYKDIKPNDNDISKAAKVLTSSALNRRIDQALSSATYDSNYISDLFKQNRLEAKRYTQELKV